jgi:hypothetical protein
MAAMSRRIAYVAGLLVLSEAGLSRADPQANVGLTLGVAGTAEDRSWWKDTRLHLGAHGDVLFGRNRNVDFGWGPYVEVLSAFHDIQTGGGVSGLIPVHPVFPFVLSAGGYGRHSSDWGWEPGVSGQLFWGSRSYNYDSAYVMAGGLLLQTRFGLGDSAERSVVIAAHLDGEVLALPFLLLYETLRGSRIR